MSTHFAFPAASFAMLVLAIPAQAQEAAIAYESRAVVQGSADEPASADAGYEAYEYETYVDPAPGHRAMRAIPPRSAGYPTVTPQTVVASGAYGQVPSYTGDQRANWLADCRAAYLPGYSADYADGYCEASLARYEQDAMGTYPLGSYPVVMVPVQTTRRVPPREIVREEWVDAEPAPR